MTMRLAAGFLGVCALLLPVAIVLIPELRRDWGPFRIVVSIVASLIMPYWFLRAAITGRSPMKEDRSAN
jgi:hypothetical protein